MGDVSGESMITNLGFSELGGEGHVFSYWGGNIYYITKGLMLVHG